MTFDFTQFLSFLQVAVGMNFGFILLDEYSILQKLQCGLMDEYDFGKRSLLSESAFVCGMIRHDIDKEWIDHKGRIRSLRKLCKARDTYENDSVFMSTVAIICCLFSGLLLFLIGLIANTESITIVNVTLVVSELEFLAICAIIFMKSTINTEHVYLMLLIAFVLFIMSAIVGIILGAFDFCLSLIPSEWNNVFFPFFVWIPYITFVCYIFNLLHIWWKKRRIYKELKIEVDSFKKKYQDLFEY